MTGQKTFESQWQRAERNRAARLFMLENWRVPVDVMAVYLEQTGRQVRLAQSGAVIAKGIQMRLTALLKAIESFGDECFARVGTIGSRFGASERTTQRALADADLLGLLTITAGRQHQTSRYAIVWKRVFDWSPPFSFLDIPEVTRCQPGVTHCHSRGDTLSARGDTLSPNTHSETHSETQFETPMRSRDGFQKFASRGRGLGGWSQPLTRIMLANSEQLDTLFTEAQIRGWIPREPAEAVPPLKLKFFTLAAYCVRRSRPALAGSNEFIEAAGAVFTAKLKAALSGDAKSWLGANEDEDTARRMLAADGRCRDADLLAEEDRRARLRARDEQQAALKSWRPAGSRP